MTATPGIITNGPSLQGLSYALKHPELWPASFRWDYSEMSHCVMGLARSIWPEDIAYATLENVCAALNIPTDRRAYEIFYNAMEHGWIARIVGRKTQDVKPKDVAKLIDKYLSGKLRVRA